MNNKKISDIYIPSEEQKAKLEEAGFFPKKPRFVFPFKFLKFRNFFLALILVSFIVGASVYALNVNLVIYLTPFEEDFIIEEKINIEKGVQPDFQNLILPCNAIETETIQSGQYQSTGKRGVEEKASGIIRVYNNYSESSQVLVATTRFLSPDGKLFRTTKRITVPGAKYDGGKLVPSYTEVQVIAAEAGADFNIDPTTFSIPGFAGTSRYTGFYGKSLNKMSGGLTKTVKFVSDTDIEESKEELEKIAFETGLNDLKNQLPENYEIVPGSLEQEVLRDLSVVQEGFEADSFNLRIKINSTALIISKDLLSEIGEIIVLNRLSENKDFNLSSLDTKYEVSGFDPSRQKFLIDLEIQGKSFNKTNKDLIFEQIKTQKIDSISGILDGNNIFFETIEFKKSPFWLKRVPLDRDKIDLKIELD